MNKNDDIQLSKGIRLHYLLALFIVIWTVSFGSAYVVIALNVNHKANDEIHRYGSSLIRKFNTLLGSGEEALDDINQLSMTECSSDTENHLKLLNFNDYFVQDVAVLMQNRHYVCSSMEGHRENPLQMTPSHLMFNHVRYWFNQTITDKAPLKRHMVMEKGNARVNMHLQILFDSYVMLKPYLVVQFLSQSQVIATSERTDRSPLLSEREGWRSQLFASLERKPFSVIVAQSEYHIKKTVVATFKKAIGWVALLALMFCFLIYALIRKHRSSFQFALINGMARGEFVPHFQPIIDTKTNTCLGAEVLTRWFCRDGSAISPAVFIPAAEQYDLMPKLTRCIIARTLKEVGFFLSKHPQYYISINLSLNDLEDNEIYELLTQVWAYYSLTPDQLRIELTERQFITKDKATAMLHRYKKAGYRIYVDDFGTGYSSLAYLNDLPIDTLKIDKVFIDNLDCQSATRSITKHIIEMANTLNLELIAEGVETEEQRHILQTLGVHVMQGWLYGKALSAPDWISFCDHDMRSK